MHFSSSSTAILAAIATVVSASPVELRDPPLRNGAGSQIDRAPALKVQPRDNPKDKFTEACLIAHGCKNDIKAPSCLAAILTCDNLERDTLAQRNFGPHEYLGTCLAAFGCDPITLNGPCDAAMTYCARTEPASVARRNSSKDHLVNACLTKLGCEGTLPNSTTPACFDALIYCVNSVHSPVAHRRNAGNDVFEACLEDRGCSEPIPAVPDCMKTRFDCYLLALPPLTRRQTLDDDEFKLCLGNHGCDETTTAETMPACFDGLVYCSELVNPSHARRQVIDEDIFKSCIEDLGCGEGPATRTFSECMGIFANCRFSAIVPPIARRETSSPRTVSSPPAIQPRCDGSSEPVNNNLNTHLAKREPDDDNDDNDFDEFFTHLAEHISDDALGLENSTYLDPMIFKDCVLNYRYGSTCNPVPADWRDAVVYCQGVATRAPQDTLMPTTLFARDIREMLAYGIQGCLMENGCNGKDESEAMACDYAFKYCLNLGASSRDPISPRSEVDYSPINLTTLARQDAGSFSLVAVSEDASEWWSIQVPRQPSAAQPWALLQGIPVHPQDIFDQSPSAFSVTQPNCENGDTLLMFSNRCDAAGACSDSAFVNTVPTSGEALGFRPNVDNCAGGGLAFTTAPVPEALADCSNEFCFFNEVNFLTEAYHPSRLMDFTLCDGGLGYPIVTYNGTSSTDLYPKGPCTRVYIVAVPVALPGQGMLDPFEGLS